MMKAQSPDGVVLREINGETVHFKLDWFAVAQLEKAYGGAKTAIAVLAQIEQSEANPAAVSAQDLLSVIWAARLKYDEAVTLRAVGDLVEAMNLFDVARLAVEVLAASAVFSNLADPSGNAPRAEAPTP